MTENPTLDALKAYFEGTTDLGYLEFHYPRFRLTQNFALSGGLPQPERLLDIGGHWLHQAVLYAHEGISVASSDIPGTFGDAQVQKVARALNIWLHEYATLDDPNCFDDFPESSFDLILFTEILEHITFNPIAMWKAIYRIMRPGARIIVTTPNYYHVQSQLVKLKRYLRREGGGLTVADILTKYTNSPHWKEYSAREVRSYFNLLSPDFKVRRMEYVSVPYFAPVNLAEKLRVRVLEQHVPILRNNIFAEVYLPTKEHGIMAAPSW